MSSSSSGRLRLRDDVDVLVDVLDVARVEDGRVGGAVEGGAGGTGESVLCCNVCRVWATASPTTRPRSV